jgi:hypothetical protein
MPNHDRHQPTGCKTVGKVRQEHKVRSFRRATIDAFDMSINLPAMLSCFWAYVTAYLLLLAFCSSHAAVAFEPPENDLGQLSDEMESKKSCALPLNQMSNLTIGILGTGRLGTHTAATWAAAGHRVLLGSRDSEKARRIIDAIRSPTGYRGKGGEQTMAIRESAHANLEGTDMAGKLCTISKHSKYLS